MPKFMSSRMKVFFMYIYISSVGGMTVFLESSLVARADSEPALKQMPNELSQCQHRLAKFSMVRTSVDHSFETKLISSFSLKPDFGIHFKLWSKTEFET